MNFLTLNLKATLVAMVMGVLLLYLGGALGPFFLFTMLYFLVLSAVVTWFGHEYKRRAGLFERQRGVRNVIANGAWPLVMALLYYILHVYSPAYQILAVAGFVGAVAAVTADKFGSEIGVLDGIPRSIISFKRVNKGASGGITHLGILAGVLASMLIGITSLFIYAYSPLYIYLFPLAIVGGIVGTLVDSLFGVFEEVGVGNKYTSNLIASVVGGLVVMAIMAMIL